MSDDAAVAGEITMRRLRDRHRDELTSRPGPAFDDDTEERVIVVAGDWHSDIAHLTGTVPRLLDASFPARGMQPTTLLHVGDFNISNGSRSGKLFLTRAAQMATERRMRILITPGNHDSWGRLGRRKEFAAGESTRLLGDVWVLPRGYRFAMGGRSFLSFGGAGSIVRPPEGQGRTWWPEEMPSDDEVHASIAAGRVDVVIAHEAPEGAASIVDRLVSTTRLASVADEEYTRLGRERVRRLWGGVRPEAFFHGHHHAHGMIHHSDGRVVYSMGGNTQPGNLAVLDLRTMDVHWLPNRGALPASR